MHLGIIIIRLKTIPTSFVIRPFQRLKRSMKEEVVVMWRWWWGSGGDFVENQYQGIVNVVMLNENGDDVMSVEVLTMLARYLL